MSRLKFARRASKDLQDIHDFIAEDNPAAAERVIKLLEVRCRALIDMPNLGRRRDELAPELRSVTVGNYVIFYLGTTSGVYIVRVLHSKQDIEKQPLIDKE